MPIRRAKQIIYGAFYVVVWVLVIVVIRGMFFRPMASCFDNIQDQGETGVDCGGPCAAICTSGAQPVAILGANTFNAVPGYDTFLAKVANPNAGLAAQSFDYSFNAYNASGALVQSFPGESFLYGSEVKYLLLVNQPVTSSITGVTVVIPTSTIVWASTSTFGVVPDLTIGNISTLVVSSTVVASGQITDNDIATLNNVLIVAVFKDANGNPIGASQTELDTIAPNQTENFSIIYPNVPGIDLAATEVEAYVER